LISKNIAIALIIVLCITFSTPAQADDGLKTLGDHIALAIVGTAVAVGVVATVLIVHYSKKRSITGCVNSAASGMSLTDEKDGRVYGLSGNTNGVTPGERVKLKGRRVKASEHDKALIWETKEVSKDLGVCKP
jgi:hypothetical protein